MNNFKVEYLEDMKFVDWDNYEKSEMKEDCIKYIKELQQRIDKAIEYIESVEPNYKDLHSEVLQSEYISNYGACELLEILKGGNND